MLSTDNPTPPFPKLTSSVPLKRCGLGESECVWGALTTGVVLALLSADGTGSTPHSGNRTVLLLLPRDEPRMPPPLSGLRRTWGTRLGGLTADGDPSPAVVAVAVTVTLRGVAGRCSAIAAGDPVTAGAWARAP